jgi:hypothetical protein
MDRVMDDTTKRPEAEVLQELMRVTAAQLEAARSGDLAALQGHLASRQRVLESLQGRRMSRQRLEAAAVMDTEMRRLLEGRRTRVQAELTQLRHGGRALAGYTTRPGRATGFVDERR